MIEIWMKPMPIIEIKFGILDILTNMQWTIIKDDWILDGKSLGKWQ